MIISPEEISKIAIFRALQLGDMLCAVPALRALRLAYPKAEITLIGLPWASTFVSRFAHYLDNFISFPGYEGLPEQPFDEDAFREFILHVQHQQFDLLLQMQGNGTVVNQMLLACGARHLAGFHNAHSRMHSDLFIEYPNYGREVDRHLLLMSHLGIPALSRDLEFPLTEQDIRDLNDLMLPLEKQNYVCIHPGSRGSWRQWPPDAFARLANYCGKKQFKIVVTGVREEEHIIKAVITKCDFPVIDLTGRTSLGAMAALLANSFLLIANCTGVSHIAAALKTPSLIISMDGEPERWRAADTNRHRVIDWKRSPSFATVTAELADLISQFEQPRSGAA